METSFRQFSDQLRLQTSNLANLSLGDSIWSDSYIRNSAADRRNFDAGDNAAAKKSNTIAPVPLPSEVNDAVNGWKTGLLGSGGGAAQKLAFGNNSGNFLDRYNNVNNKNVNDDDGTASLKNGKFFNNKFESFNGNFNGNFNVNGEVKSYFNKAINKNYSVGSSGKKSNNNSNDYKKKNSSSDKNNNSSSSNNNNSVGSVLDKKYKTLPPSEALPRNEAIGGYIFVCNNDTMEENLRRQLFGLPSRYRDSVRAITPGLPLFLYNYSTHQLHGIFEAASFGGANIDPTAWEDKKNPGESRFPAQVKVVTRKLYQPLEEDSFRPHLHHYDGPKFRLELNVEEALSILDEFTAKDA